MTLYRYILMQFLATFMRILMIFVGLIFIIGVVDELGSLKDGEGIARAAYLSALGQIETIYTILPLIVMIASITLFMTMSRSSEIVAIRATGMSGIRFLIAPAFGALIIGLLTIALFNPIVTTMASRYNIEVGRQQASAVLSFGESGLWLRQGGAGQQTIVNAQSSQQSGLRLNDVSFISFDDSGFPISRIEAQSAQLVPQAWVLSGADAWDLTLRNPQAGRKTLPDGTRLDTDLVPEDMTSGFGKPASVPIWSLPAHISSLEKAGFSARSFRVWLQSEFAKPLYLVVMVLVAAGFTMRHIRAGNRAQMVIFAVLIGFGIFFLRNIAQVFGQNGQIPIILAAWGPTLAASLLAISLLLHLEEG